MSIVAQESHSCAKLFWNKSTGKNFTTDSLSRASPATQSWEESEPRNTRNTRNNKQTETAVHSYVSVQFSVFYRSKSRVFCWFWFVGFVRFVAKNLELISSLMQTAGGRGKRITKARKFENTKNTERVWTEVNEGNEGKKWGTAKPEGDLRSGTCAGSGDHSHNRGQP